MIIWRGFGGLAVGYGLLVGMIFGGVGSTLLSDANLPFSLAIGFILAAAATWFTGIQLNQVRPRKAIAGLEIGLRQQLDDSVEQGTFALGPGHPLPQSREQAQQMADWYYDQTITNAQRALNQHTVFWIPMQYFAVVWVLIAGFALFSGIARSL